jgi:proteasome lid subunit RPN8/RPN11
MARSKTALKPPSIVMESEVARKIRQHSRSSMKAEVCGVLIGSNGDERTTVTACIAGINAAQGGTHVTFTQDTWEHIYKVKDCEFPDDKIVGWYHSHPGFGVFLSEHDMFIQENFFSGPHQIAWVYDPHTDEEGCFGWVNGKVEKLSGIRFGYSQNVQVDVIQKNSDDSDQSAGIKARHELRHAADPATPAFLRWAVSGISYLAVLVLGFILGYQFFGFRLDRLLQEERQQLQDQLLAPPPSPAPPAPVAPDQKPSTSQEGKKQNGKR